MRSTIFTGFSLIAVALGVLGSCGVPAGHSGAEQASARGEGEKPAAVAEPERSAGGESRNKRALLIGVDSYENANFGSLSFCGADALALRDALVGKAGFLWNQVWVMHDKQDDRSLLPTRGKIQRMLSEMLKLPGENDFMLVAFSGHGRESHGQHYLCPSDADPDQPQSTMISIPRLYEMLAKECRAGQKLVLVDACRDDPQGGRAASQPMTKSFDESLRQVPEGLLVLASCTTGQKSFELPELRHGVFMHHMIEGLSGKADDRWPEVQGNQNGQVEVSELFYYAAAFTKNTVFAKYKRAQTPEKYGTETGPIVLARIERPTSSPAPEKPVEKPREEMPAERPAVVESPSGQSRELTNSIGMKLVLVPAGEFLMGSPEDEKDARSNEQPQHRVRITKAFYLGAYEVTQGEFERVMGKNPSYFSASGEGKEKVSGEDTSRFPVEQVSWEEAVEFCRKLSQQEGKEYRLPTEAEWEYACRAGSTTRYSFGDAEEGLGEHTWYTGNSESRPHAVGSKRANAYGLYDMHGNVCEWCSDWYDPGYYGASPGDDPKGLESGWDRVFRGGGRDDLAGLCRSAVRLRLTPVHRSRGLGFRVARAPAD